MFIVINDEKLLEKYDLICTKKSNIIGKKNGKPVYGGKYLNTKLEPYNGKINTESHCICLTGIILNFVYKIKRNLTSVTSMPIWKSVNMKKRKQRNGRGTSKRINYFIRATKVMKVMLSLWK